MVLGGGQEAMKVTTTSSRAGKFEVRFYHMLYEEEIGRVKGHFGPLNTVAFHPQGTGLVLFKFTYFVVLQVALRMVTSDFMSSIPTIILLIIHCLLFNFYKINFYFTVK